MTHGEIAFAFIVGAISALGMVLSSWMTARATETAAELSARATERQIALNSLGKIAEFRQAWINDLRNAMTMFIGLGADPRHGDPREVVEAGTKIELLMNRKDKRYGQLVESMSDFRLAIADDDSHYDPEPFVELCQNILKDEWEVLKTELLDLSSLQH